MASGDGGGTSYSVVSGVFIFDEQANELLGGLSTSKSGGKPISINLSRFDGVSYQNGALSIELNSSSKWIFESAYTYKIVCTTVS